jgi:hypothetical protein
MLRNEIQPSELLDKWARICIESKPLKTIYLRLFLTLASRVC